MDFMQSAGVIHTFNKNRRLHKLQGFKQPLTGKRMIHAAQGFYQREAMLLRVDRFTVSLVDMNIIGN